MTPPMVHVREAKPADEAFIIDSWKKSFERAAAVRGADREHYRIEMARTIRRLCSKATVLIACAIDDHDHLLGFAAFAKDGDVAELHYVYIKQDFRRLGIAKQLLSGITVRSYTFAPPTPRPLPKEWAFTPRFTI